MKILSAYTALLLIGVVTFSCGKPQRGMDKNTHSQEFQSPAQGKDSIWNPTTPSESRISGEFMKAFLVASEAFFKEPAIPPPKRRIENYEFEFRQDRDAYYIFFIAKRVPPDAPTIGGETELGKSVTYSVSKQDFKVIARLFYK